MNSYDVFDHSLGKCRPNFTRLFRYRQAYLAKPLYTTPAFIMNFTS
jgi:hypothetical protein